MSRKNHFPVAWVWLVQALLLAFLTLFAAERSAALVEDPIPDPFGHQEDGDGDEWPESGPPPFQVSVSEFEPTPAAAPARPMSGQRAAPAGDQAGTLTAADLASWYARWIGPWIRVR